MSWRQSEKSASKKIYKVKPQRFVLLRLFCFAAMWGYGEINRICRKNYLSSPAGELTRRKPRLRGYFASLKATNICSRGGYYLTAKFVVTYCLVFCRVRRLDAPMPRERHKIFEKGLFYRPLVGTALAAVRYRRSRYNNFDLFIIGLLPSRPTIIKLFTLPAFRHFFSV